MGQINQTEGGFDKFSKGYNDFGLHLQKDNSIKYKEWAPNAVEASLVGDFSKSSWARWGGADRTLGTGAPAQAEQPCR